MNHAYLPIPLNVLGDYRYNVHEQLYQLAQNILYWRANQNWQWRIILFTIVKWNINLYTPFELTRIDRSLVPDNFVTKYDVTVTLGWQDSTFC